MKRDFRALSAVVFTTMLLVTVSACKKKAPIAPPVAPAPAAAPAPAETTPAPAGVRINSFTAEPRSIEQGQSATLRWSVANATDLAIDQGLGEIAANGSRQVFPSNTVTYTLTAKGASGSDTRSVTVEVTAPPPPPPPPSTEPRLSGADMLNREAQDVYFDYDKSDVRDDGRTALQHDADLLKRIFASDASFTVVIEGNCDERGSAEYNLGLGDRRATSAKEFLVSLGLPADRISTISYGKDRPVCTETNEACYQRNRHDHLSPGK